MPVKVNDCVFPNNIYKTSRGKLPGIYHINVEEIHILIGGIVRGVWSQFTVWLQDIKFFIIYRTQVMSCPVSNPHFIREIIFGTKYMLNGISVSFGKIDICITRNMYKTDIIILRIEAYPVWER